MPLHHYLYDLFFWTCQLPTSVYGDTHHANTRQAAFSTSSLPPQRQQQEKVDLWLHDEFTGRSTLRLAFTTLLTVARHTHHR